MYILCTGLINQKFDGIEYCYSKSRQKRETNIILKKQNLKFIWKELKNFKNYF
jgi:hypothetical protein